MKLEIRISIISVYTLLFAFSKQLLVPGMLREGQQSYSSLLSVGFSEEVQSGVGLELNHTQVGATADVKQEGNVDVLTRIICANNFVTMLLFIAPFRKIIVFYHYTNAAGGATFPERPHCAYTLLLHCPDISTLTQISILILLIVV